MTHPSIHIIAGPTASGKSAHAMELAEKIGGVIINADSQQVYAELRILTARPSEADEARVPHRLYGCMSAAEACSAGKWLRLAKMEMDWVLAQGKPAIVVGGTGLYFKALMQGIAEIPDVPPEIRAQASGDYDAMGHDAFRARLKEVDALLAEKIKPNDRQRLIRAWEVWVGTAKPLSWWQQQSAKPAYDESMFTVKRLMPERETLYARCDERVNLFIQNGAVDEVKSLISSHLDADLPAMRIIGVPELTEYLRGGCSLSEAITKIQQMTRNYAKRQLTWFRNQMKDT